MYGSNPASLHNDSTSLQCSSYCLHHIRTYRRPPSLSSRYVFPLGHSVALPKLLTQASRPGLSCYYLYGHFDSQRFTYIIALRVTGSLSIKPYFPGSLRGT